LTLTNVPVPKPDPAPPSGAPAAGALWSPGDATAAWLARHSHVYRLIDQRLKEMAASKAQGEHGPDQTGGPIPDDYRVYEKRPGPEIARAWAITEALLRSLRDEVKAAGGELVVFYVPARAVVYLDEWERMKKRHGLAAERWSIEQARDDLMAICRRDHLDCID